VLCTPDIIVQPNAGGTPAFEKQVHHGAFALDETNVLMLVSK